MSMSMAVRLNQLEKQVAVLQAAVAKKERPEVKIIVRRHNAKDFEREYLIYMAKVQLGQCDLSQKKIFVSRQLRDDDDDGQLPRRPSDLSTEQAERILDKYGNDEAA